MPPRLIAEQTSRLERIELDDPRWLSFVSSCSEAGPFHHPAWGRLLSDCYRLPVFVLAAVHEERVLGGVPLVAARRRRWVSLPFTDYCPPLAGSIGEAAIAKGLRTAAGADSVELRGRLDVPGGFPVEAGYRHVLPLDADPEVVREALHDSVIRNIRKAQRVGVEVAVATSPEELVNDFYALHLMVRKRHGVPIQPRRFFRLFWERLVEPGLAELRLARIDGAPAAGAVTMAWNRTTIYKFGAADPRFSAQRPTNLVLWQSIEQACLRGATTFDFGRTDDGDEGLRTFKRRFGGEELPLTYTLLADSAPPQTDHKAQRLLGRALRNSPPFATRLAGELLYRFVA